jgi:hypothetical protein
MVTSADAVMTPRYLTADGKGPWTRREVMYVSAGRAPGPARLVAMNARFLRPSARNDDRGPPPLDDAIPADHAPADRACCCSARAMVQVVMPPTPARPHRTELLLCGHHYRASRRVLATAAAAVRELPGIPGRAAVWIRLDPHASPAHVS